MSPSCDVCITVNSRYNSLWKLSGFWMPFIIVYINDHDMIADMDLPRYALIVMIYKGKLLTALRQTKRWDFVHE